MASKRLGLMILFVISSLQFLQPHSARRPPLPSQGVSDSNATEEAVSVISPSARVQAPPSEPASFSTTCAKRPRRTVGKLGSTVAATPARRPLLSLQPLSALKLVQPTPATSRKARATPATKSKSRATRALILQEEEEDEVVDLSSPTGAMEPCGAPEDWSNNFRLVRKYSNASTMQLLGLGDATGANDEGPHQDVLKALERIVADWRTGRGFVKLLRSIITYMQLLTLAGVTLVLISLPGTKAGSITCRVKAMSADTDQPGYVTSIEEEMGPGGHVLINCSSVAQRQHYFTSGRYVERSGETLRNNDGIMQTVKLAGAVKVCSDALATELESLELPTVGVSAAGAALYKILDTASDALKPAFQNAAAHDTKQVRSIIGAVLKHSQLEVCVDGTPVQLPSAEELPAWIAAASVLD